jgi:hypothetical protein
MLIFSCLLTNVMDYGRKREEIWMVFQEEALAPEVVKGWLAALPVEILVVL